MLEMTSNGLPVRLGGGPDGQLRDSTRLLADPLLLRQRYRNDGYLYLRGVVDPAEVRRLRHDYFSRFDPIYLEPGTTPEEGVFSGRRPPRLPDHGIEGHPAHAFVRDPMFNRFAGATPLMELAATVLGGPVTPLPRRIVRHFDRTKPVASRAHADLPYLAAGSDEVTTMWIPLGDCPPEGGGLVYLDGSHHVDVSRFAPLRSITDRPGDDRPISHDLSWVADQLGLRWRWADYRAGDLTIHGPRIVHASLDTSTDTMRLSADLRFLRSGRRADPRWLVPWSGDDGN